MEPLKKDPNPLNLSPSKQTQSPSKQSLTSIYPSSHYVSITSSKFASNSNLSALSDLFEKNSQILNEISLLHGTSMTISPRDRELSLQVLPCDTSLTLDNSSPPIRPKGATAVTSSSSSTKKKSSNSSPYISPPKKTTAYNIYSNINRCDLLDTDPRLMMNIIDPNETPGIKIYKCSLPTHENFPLNFICLEQSCPRKRLICTNCMEEFHKEHLGSCASILEYTAFVQEQIPQLPHSRLNFEFLLDNIKLNFEKSIEIISYMNTILSELLSRIKESYETILRKLAYLESFSSSHFSKLLQEINFKSQSSCEALEEILEGLTRYVGKNSKDTNLHWYVDPNDSLIFFDSFNKFEREYYNRLEKAFKYISLVANDVAPKVSKIHKLTQSPCRFKSMMKNWGSALNYAQVITFQPLESGIILHGFGHFEPLKYPADNKVCYDYALMEGNQINGQIILEIEGVIEKDKTLFENNMCNILFKEGVNLMQGKLYTIRWINRTAEHDSYFGIGEVFSTLPFRFMETDCKNSPSKKELKKLNKKPFEPGATNITQGYIPYLIYEGASKSSF